MQKKQSQNEFLYRLRELFDRMVRGLSDGIAWLSDKLTGLIARPKKPSAAAAKKPGTAVQKKSSAVQEIPQSAAADFGEKARIKEWLKTARFRTRLFGGVDEADVWKKIGQLNRLYEQAVISERARYDALLQHYRLMVGEMSEDDLVPMPQEADQSPASAAEESAAPQEYADVQYGDYDEDDEYYEDDSQDYSEEPEEYDDDSELWYSGMDEEDDDDEYADSDR